MVFGMNLKKKLTSAQKTALFAYNTALASEDRYLGSVFVTAIGRKDREDKTAAAYAACKSLGLTNEHGL